MSLNDEEKAILNGLIDWAREVLPAGFECEVRCINDNVRLSMSHHGNSCLIIEIVENGISMDNHFIAWTRFDIQREFQRTVLEKAARAAPEVMLNNPKYQEAWKHIMTQDVSGDLDE
jgi:hypothetical protein